MKEIEKEKILAYLTHVSEEELKQALDDVDDYKEAQIPKRDGGYRTIYIPSETLKKVQRRILNRILKKIWDTRYVGIYGLAWNSYVGFAKSHSGGRFFFQLDLKNAFSSAKIREYGFMEAFYNQITNWTFREAADSFLFEHSIPYESVGEIVDLIFKLTTVKGRLPQGAPTSPFLFYLFLIESNVISKINERLVREYCPEGEFYAGINCYVDNFVLSENRPILPQVQEEIISKLEEFGFKVNPKKIRYQDFRNGSPMICGLRISEKDGQRRVVLPRKTVRKWRAIIHQAQFKPELRRKVEGFVASLKPIYGEVKDFPNQILIPYRKFQRSLS